MTAPCRFPFLLTEYTATLLLILFLLFTPTIAKAYSIRVVSTIYGVDSVLLSGDGSTIACHADTSVYYGPLSSDLHILGEVAELTDISSDGSLILMKSASSGNYMMLDGKSAYEISYWNMNGDIPTNVAMSPTGQAIVTWHEAVPCSFLWKLTGEDWSISSNTSFESVQAASQDALLDTNDEGSIFVGQDMSFKAKFLRMKDDGGAEGAVLNLSNYAAEQLSADATTSIVNPTTDSGMAIVWRLGISANYLGSDDLFPGGSKGCALTSNGTVIVGSGKDLSAFQQAFIWDSETGLRSLQSDLAGKGVDLTGWNLTEASAINDAGTIIVGIGQYQGQDVVFAVDYTEGTASPNITPALNLLLMN
jgi:uncharacterized membrane protein